MENSRQSQFSEEDIKNLGEIISKALTDNRSPCDYCATPERRKTHREQHEFVTSLIQAADKWNDIKSDLLRDMLRWGTRIGVSALLIGLFILAKRYLGGIQ